MRFLIGFLLSISLIINSFAKALDIQVGAEAAILINGETGRILFEKNSKEPRFPASTTKLATALYCLEQKKLHLERLVAPSQECLLLEDPKQLALGIRNPKYRLQQDASSFGIKNGEIFVLESLFYGMMLVSGDDAANAIAEAYSGSIDSFIEELNEYVKKLGCTSTHFCNPHGLHHHEHISTAYDLALIMQRALKVEVLKKIMSSKFYICPKTNKQLERKIFQYNKLIKDGKYYYPYALGGKTGFTSKAGRTLVAAAEKEGRTLIAVVLGCKTHDSRFEDVIRMFETAFNERKERRLMIRAGNYSRKIEDASSNLEAALKEDIYWDSYLSEEVKVKAFVYWDSISLPLAKGEKVGEIRLVDEEGRLLSKTPLYAIQDVKRTFMSLLLDFFKKKKKIH